MAFQLVDVGTVIAPKQNDTPPAIVNWSPLLTLKDIEKEVVRQAITHHSGNLTAAAEDLGIGVRSLNHKLRKLFTKEEYAVLRPPNEWWLVPNKLQKHQIKTKV